MAGMMLQLLPAAGFENMNGEYVITKTPTAGAAKCESALLPFRSVSHRLDQFTYPCARQYQMERVQERSRRRRVL